MEFQEAQRPTLATSPEVIHAVCWSTGLIEFCEDIPDGAAVMASGPHDELVSFIEVTARHGYGPNQGKLFVPGVFEARNQTAAMAELLKHLDWIRQSAPEGIKVRGEHSLTGGEDHVEARGH